MNLPVYLAILVFAILLSGICLVAILLYLDPNSSNLLVFILLYISILISSAGIFTLTGFLIRRISRRKKASLPIKLAINNLEISFRQGVLLSVILVIALILQSQRILDWWYILILVALIGLTEWWLSRR